VLLVAAATDTSELAVTIDCVEKLSKYGQSRARKCELKEIITHAKRKASQT
jgi:hypothetical protein